MLDPPPAWALAAARTPRLSVSSGWEGRRINHAAIPVALLPLDLLREVLDRCDHETLVRCAASSRLLSRCMLDDPSFVRRHANITRGFAPSLFLGLFHSPRRRGTRFVEAPEPAVIPREPIRAFLSDNARLLRSFDEPAGACCGGLVVLRRRRRTRCRTIELCVCNPMTGRYCFLPAPPEVHDMSLALLVGENASTSSPFQLLAVNHSTGTLPDHATIQLFSSSQPFPMIMPGGAWGPVCRVAVPRAADDVSSIDPVVINRVAYWLSLSEPSCDVLALEIDAARMKMIRGPWAHEQRSVALGSTADRRLSLVAVEKRVISMWALSKDDRGRWEWIVAVVREGIIAPRHWIRLDWVGERSGVVIMCTSSSAQRVVLNLETREVAGHMLAEWPGYLYEMDLPSLITALESSYV